MSKVTLKGFIVVPEAELALVQSELVNHVRLTQKEPGCLSFRVTQNADNPLQFDVFEEFSDRAAFEHHQQRVKASHWGKITQNVTRHYEVFEE